MNSILEKEKKLNIALAKLKNLNLEDPDIKKNIEILGEQKNQLEIEKQEKERSEKIDVACKRLLVNEIIEEYEVLG